MAASKKHRLRSKSPEILRGLPAEYQTSIFRTATEERQRRLLQQLRAKYRREGIVLYVGAGVQQSIGLPGWRELLGALTIRVMADDAESRLRTNRSIINQPSAGEISEIKKAVAAYNRPLLMMARTIKSRLRSAAPRNIANALYWTGGFSEYMLFEIIEASQKTRRSKNYPPLPSSPLIDSLVSIVQSQDEWAGVKAIVNYNYDDLLDLKLREAGIRSVTVTSGKHSSQMDEVPCYHVHGILPFWQYIQESKRLEVGNFVFGEDDYHNEYANPLKWSNVLQTSFLSRLSGLLVGLSLEDPNIRRLIDTTHRQFPRIQHYAILKRGRSLKTRGRSRTDTVANLFEKVETRAFAEMGVQILWVDEYEEIPDLVCYVGGVDPTGKQKTGSKKKTT